MNSPQLSRFLIPVFTGIAGLAIGWWSHLPTPPPAPTARATLETASSPRTEPARAMPMAAATVADPKAVLDRMLSADSTNMMELLEAIGDLTRLTDPQIRQAWSGLSERAPVNTMGSSAAVIYLWGRMTRMGFAVEIPRGWGADNFTSTMAFEKTRGKVPELRRKLESGQPLGDAERRAVYAAAVKANPFDAVKLWMAHTKPWDFQADGRFFGDALSDPRTRESVMAEARKWQTDKDLMGALTLTLARQWIERDPVAAEQWLNQPAQADVRGVVMQHVVNVRASSDPASAWRWSETLPDRERRQALGMSASQFANTQPDIGAQLIADLQDPADRQAAIREYGRVLAANNLEQWKKWRDTLPEDERGATNESAFPLWVFHEPENAVAWLNAQPDGPAKDTMIDTLVDVYAPRDPQTAAKWIQSIPDPQRRREAAISALAAIGPNQLDSVRTILSAVPN